MDYEGQICRAPMERVSFMLPVTAGCPYNACKFCNLFRHLDYRELPMEQIEGELRRVRDLGGDPKKVFLGDGNAFGMSTERLLAIEELIHGYFPGCRAINADATVTGILKKSDEELKALADGGISHLYLGIESGLEDVLAFMNKDHTTAQAREAIERLHRAGMVYDAHIMTGVSGAGRGEENARRLAEFLNETRPGHVVNFSMFLHEEVPLYRHVLDGSFKPADELENLKEERLLVSLIDADVLYDGFHDFIEVRTRGRLPNDREKMLAKLDSAIERYENREPLYAFVCGECSHMEKSADGEKVWTADRRSA